MPLPLLARVAGVLGGLCLLVRAVADVEALFWPGLVLVGVALAALGADLVSTGAPWLRAIVAVALPLLVWSVVEVAGGAGEGRAADAVAGVAVAAVCVLQINGSRQQRPKGSHAA